MKLDICIPEDNEEELIDRAKQLGYEGLVFLYSPQELEEIESEDFTVFTGILVDSKDVSGLKKKDFSEADLVVAEGDGTESTNRKILSDKRIDLTINLSHLKGKEHTHYRKSTLNQVLAKMARDNNMSYSISFARILKEESRRVKLLGRLMQNVKIFQKFKVPLLIHSFATCPKEMRNYDDLKSVAKVLGVKRLSSLYEIIRKKADSNFIREGLKKVKK